MRKTLLFLFSLIFVSLQAVAYGTISINNGWKIILDEKAEWKNDSLLLPDELTDLIKLKVNPPTFGWTELYKRGVDCSLPASVEEYFGKDNRWTYHGVSWFSRSFDVPSEWKGCDCMLTIGQYRQRIEVYVNEKLAGYDAVGMAPYRCDISKFLKYGAKNHIAFRITNPGGNRGWTDFIPLSWGKTKLVPDKDYGGIGGDVKIELSSKIRIDDIYVKNLLPAKANNIEIDVTSTNLLSMPFSGNINIDVLNVSTGSLLASFKKSYKNNGESNHFKLKASIPKAKLWDFDNPNLYKCRVTILDSKGIALHRKEQIFGFRVFEVRKTGNKNDFYLNAKRIRIRSAIDWSFYAFTGFYPKADVAKRSIEAVKQVGHNCLSFHRKPGDALMLNDADELGVGIYEEPGGFHSGGDRINIEESHFATGQIMERIKRMVIRDRNHPALLIYTLCNEDNAWTKGRKDAMELIGKIDGTRLVVNSSGESGGGSMMRTQHLRPYEKEIRNDYCDHHTVFSGTYFNENDLNLMQNQSINKNPNFIDHLAKKDSTVVYWGEVRCFPGVFNANLIYHQWDKKRGYDINLFESQARKADEIFKRANMKGLANGNIKSSSDLTRQAAYAQMYCDGRLGQKIMSADNEDGYAINGWSPGPDCDHDWSSAITDLNRNVNGYPQDMAYWNRPLQIAIFRVKGKFFSVNQEAIFKVCLINENKLKSGSYLLKLSASDGEGKATNFSYRKTITVQGGDVYAQDIIDSLRVKMNKEWSPGYITIKASLLKNGKEVANGTEQVLLQNRGLALSSLKKNIYTVCGWKAAKDALAESKAQMSDKPSKNSIILLGNDVTESEWSDALRSVNDGAKMIVRTDSLTAEKLYSHGLLSKRVTIWGGLQTGHWRGNGYAYIGDMTGKPQFPSKGVVSTRSWEVDGDPKGFWPFESNHSIYAYGLYFSNHQQSDKRFDDNNNLLVTVGGIRYGKGFIILDASYFVDDNKPFNDMLFYGMIRKITDL